MNISKPQYIIHEQDDEGHTSCYMSCESMISQVKSGNWGTNCLIKESYIFGNEAPYAVRHVARYSKDEGFIMIETDHEFSQFLETYGIGEIESPALNELRPLFK